MSEYYVYILLDPRRNNEPFYVGKGKGDRWKKHLSETYQNTENRRKWCKIEAIRRTGMMPFVEFAVTNLDEDEAFEIESALILKYGRKGYEDHGILTNICIDSRPPNPSGKPRSDETRQKIGDKQRGELNHRYGLSWSKEEREKRRQWALINGIKPPVRDQPHTEETKKKMSEAAKGKPKSSEHKEKCRIAALGKKHGRPPEDRIAKIRASNVNAPSPNKKVTWDAVDDIRMLFRIGKTRKEIQRNHYPNLSYTIIADIIAERTWKEEFKP
jgi:hypothetical protein